MSARCCQLSSAEPALPPPAYARRWASTRLRTRCCTPTSPGWARCLANGCRRCWTGSLRLGRAATTSRAAAPACPWPAWRSSPRSRSPRPRSAPGSAPTHRFQRRPTIPPRQCLSFPLMLHAQGLLAAGMEVLLDVADISAAPDKWEVWNQVMRPPLGCFHQCSVGPVPGHPSLPLSRPVPTCDGWF